MDWRKIAVAFLILIIFQCAAYVGLGYYHYTHKTTIITNTTFTQFFFEINGSDSEHIKVYDVMVLDGVDEKQVRRALLLAPNAFGYRIVEDNSSRYSPDVNGVPFPNDTEKFLILFIDGERYPKCPAAAFTVLESERITVLVKDNYPDVLIMNIIVHECCHNIEGQRNTVDYYYVYENEMKYWGFKQWIVEKDGEDISSYGWGNIYNMWVIDEYMVDNY